MNLNQRVYLSLRDHSNIFPNRASVLHHMYFIIGNGFEWHEGKLCNAWLRKSNGELVKTFEDECKPPTRLKISPKRIYNRIVKEWNEYYKTNQAKRFALSLKSYHNSPLDDETFIKNHINRTVESNWNEWLKHSSHNKLQYIYPFCEDHARICSIPEKVDTDYFEGAIEAIEDYLAFDPLTATRRFEGPYKPAEIKDSKRNQELVKKFQKRFNLTKP